MKAERIGKAVVVTGDTIGTVDELGALLAERDKLDKRIDALKASLKGTLQELGVGTVTGVEYVARMSVYDRKVTDWKKVAMRLKPSVQLVTAHTKVSTVQSLRVNRGK